MIVQLGEIPINLSQKEKPYQELMKCKALLMIMLLLQIHRSC